MDCLYRIIYAKAPSKKIRLADIHLSPRTGGNPVSFQRNSGNGWTVRAWCCCGRCFPGCFVIWVWWKEGSLSALRRNVGLPSVCCGWGNPTEDTATRAACLPVPVRATAGGTHRRKGDAGWLYQGKSGALGTETPAVTSIRLANAPGGGVSSAVFAETRMAPFRGGEMPSASLSGGI